MRSSPLSVLATAAVLISSFSLPARAADPLYFNDFQSAEVGKLPEGVMVMAGGFAVTAEGDQKFIELPGAPLDTFGLLFGPAQPAGGNATGKFFGTKSGRKFPAFGISLGGVGGYRLMLSAGKKALEIVKGDETKASVPIDFASGAWTSLRLEVKKTDTGWMVQGKSWTATAPEPAEWQIHFESPDAPPAGRAAIWGSPYAGTPIRYDDLRIEAN